MNDKEFLRQLIAALSSICVHDRLLAEIKEELKRSGHEREFVSILLQRLKFLREYGVHAVQHPQFEPVAHGKHGVYSMHIESRYFNIRILYGFLSNRQPALLLAFHERAGHRKTDYTGKDVVAAKRLAELEREL